ncbi:hypothetical protein [Frondihabitans australicus]|uniref:Uncharacterized protein n=1 Tax=Frondihabitans australicus TaxID=386892 RepID=A0A495IKY3_9MICO|nr:hypothetical protein [Frondihabitans australicus]RKR76390.1 hypothetical protein C8E83_3563 [Frondihabitans australicus]
MEYSDLRLRVQDLGLEVDRTVYHQPVDHGWTDRVQGTAFNIVRSNGVRIWASGDRGDFFQQPGPHTVFDSVDDACEWIWRDIRFHVSPDLLTDEERRAVVAEAQASIDGLL